MGDTCPVGELLPEGPTYPIAKEWLVISPVSLTVNW